MSDDLCYLNALEALDLFRKRKLSPVELLDAVIARSETVEKTINAFSFQYFDQAREAAKAAEQAYVKGTARPLEGLPTAIKDETAIEGQIVTNGSLLFKDNVVDHTDVCAQRLLDAGAIVHARSTTPEFSACFVTNTRLWGATRNPWNTDMTPGGSSGGAGASLAAGTSTLANGSDIGGSIRCPASQCGLVGFKPPYGRVPEMPPWNLDFYCHEGPMARSVTDCILMQNVMAGPHPADITSLKPKLEIPLQLEGIKGRRIGYSMDLGFMEIDPDVQRNTLDAMERFKEAGAIVEEVELGWTRQVMTTVLIHLNSIMTALINEDAGDPAQRDQLTPGIRHLLETWEPVSAKNLIAELEYTSKMYESLSKVFETHDLLITPTTAATGIAADFEWCTDDLVINGKKVDSLLGWTLTSPFNALSRCPVLSVPSGRATNGVPTGIQIVGPTYEDVRVFQAGLAYEQAAGGPMINPGNRPLS